MSWKHEAEEIFNDSLDGYDVKEGSKWDDRFTLVVEYVGNDELTELLALAKSNNLSLLVIGSEDGGLEIELKKREEKMA